MNRGGVLVVGGYFGSLTGLSVKADAQGVHTHLRSRFGWTRVRQEVGFADISIISNKNAYETARILAEDRILIARKK